MALRLDGRHYGELYDYWGGLRDVRGGLVRVLHSLSFVDDPTRMMRAVRFEQRFSFQIEERTLQLIQEARPLVRQVSGDRLRHELILILSEERWEAILNRLQALELLPAIHPALRWESAFAPPVERALHGQPGEEWQLPEKMGSLLLRHGLAFLTWLMHFPIEEAQSISRQLRLPGEIADNLKAALKLRADLPDLAGAPPSQITSRLDLEPAPALYAVTLFPLPEAVEKFIRRYLDHWRAVWPYTNGDTLRKMNLPPGPYYRLLLARLRGAWLDGLVTSEEAERALLQQMLANPPEKSEGQTR
jgi:tRNA nucleotidyltransferase (CCA-adding enzyme)